MIYILDTADLEDIKHCNEYFPISGVTTNPSIISKEHTDFWKLVKDIRSIIGKEKIIMVQTLQKEASKIIEDALILKKELGGEFFVKIPIGEEGLKATMELKRLGVGVLMTAIFTPAQALVAARAGASYVAPYVNRLDNIIGDGTNVVAQIVKQFKNYNLDCKVLAASFKNAEQVHKCAMYGCHAVTVSRKILSSLVSHPMTDAALSGFTKDWQEVYGDKTILDF